MRKKTLLLHLFIISTFAICLASEGINNNVKSNVNTDFKPFKIHPEDVSSFDEIKLQDYIELGLGRAENNHIFDLPEFDSRDGSITLIGADAYGDGWNGNELCVNGVCYAVSGSSGSWDLGVFASGDYTVTCGGGSWQSEVSWAFLDVAGNTILSGGAPFDGTLTVGDSGCADADAHGLTVGGGSWGSEVGWSIDGTSYAGSVGDFSLCLADGDYTFSMTDAYGDGWNGNTATITDSDGAVVASGGLTSGSSGSFDFNLGGPPPVQGCTDPDAPNYNPDAEIDDGSCDAYCGDATYGCGYYLDFGYNCEQLVGWGYDCDTCYDSGDCPVFGCMDPDASNYNPDATDDDGSCQYPCTDNDLLLVVDGGSWQGEVSWEFAGYAGGAPFGGQICIPDGIYTFTMYDSYGDGWNGNTFTLTDADGNVIATGTLESGAEGSTEIAVCGAGYDECGVCGGDGVLDACGVCDGPGVDDHGCCSDGAGPGGEIADCAGDCGGAAIVGTGGDCCYEEDVDICGYCGEGEEEEEEEEPTAGGVFISEAAEGSSNHKYLEFYNATGETVDLSGYAYPSVSNAPSTPGEYEYWNAFDDGATVAAGDVYVVCHGSADAFIQAECDETHTYLSNGDDGYCLVQGSEDAYDILDCVGDWYGDPGSGWDVAGVNNATKNHTIVRKSTVTFGNEGDWFASAGTDEDDSEWIVFDQNTWDNVGFHEYGGSGVAGNDEISKEEHANNFVLPEIGSYPMGTLITVGEPGVSRDGNVSASITADYWSSEVYYMLLKTGDWWVMCSADFIPHGSGSYGTDEFSCDVPAGEYMFIVADSYGDGGGIADVSVNGDYVGTVNSADGTVGDWDGDGWDDNGLLEASITFGVSDLPSPASLVTFDIDGVEDCGFVSVTGTWDGWSGWGAHTDSDMQASVPAGDQEFVILCVNTVDGWWYDIWGNSTIINAPIDGDCWNGNYDYANYAFNVDGSGADLTVSYCAGSCDATCPGICYDEDACNLCEISECAYDDCVGECGGDAFIDDCGDCSGGTSGHGENDDMDECGVCDGDDSTCTGCTDEMALNYDDSMIIDDGSCYYDWPAQENLFFTEAAEGSSNHKYLEVYNASGGDVDMSWYSLSSCSNGCDEDPVSTCIDYDVVMNDAYGDGWNGNTLCVGSDCVGLSSGSSGTATLCISGGDQQITCGGGSWQSEVSWEIVGVASGGAPYDATHTFESGDTEIIWDYPDNVTFDVGSVVSSGDVFVICHGSADASIQEECDAHFTYLSNGDDVFALTQLYSGNILDIIGEAGPDPGSGWDVAGVNNATKDHTIVRKSSVESGNGGDWASSAGTDTDDSEWTVLDKDTWLMLGFHCGSAGDIDGNGETNVLDVVLLIEYILGTYDEFSMECGDMNSAEHPYDGVLDISDIIILVEVIVEDLARQF